MLVQVFNILTVACLAYHAHSIYRTSVMSHVTCPWPLPWWLIDILWKGTHHIHAITSIPTLGLPFCGGIARASPRTLFRAFLCKKDIRKAKVATHERGRTEDWLFPSKLSEHSSQEDLSVVSSQRSLLLCPLTAAGTLHPRSHLSLLPHLHQLETHSVVEY